MKMKSDLSGLFLLLFLLLLSSTIPGLGTVVMKQYTYFQSHYTWQEAQTYCSMYYDDLATISTQSDEDLIPSMQEYNAWIGLQRNTNSSSMSWSWTTGKHNNKYLWANSEPDPDDTCAIVYWPSRSYYGNRCGRSFFFYCHETRSGHISGYHFIPLSMTQSEAQQYCRSVYADLAAFEKNNDVRSFVRDRDFPIWTGLHRDEITWKWSSGSSAYRHWASDEPGPEGNCVSISSTDKMMATQDCSARLPFVCFKDNVVLVKESKTWEEALEHCRALGLKMLSVQPGEDHDHVMGKVMKADTEGVWTGLRFLAGEWMWMDGADVFYTDLLLCPPLGHFCGALSKNNQGSMEPTDCSERKNFLCYML